MTENTTASGAADDLHPVFTRVLPDLPDTKPFTLFKAGFRQALIAMASAPVAPTLETEAVRWEFRWLNPANSPYSSPSEMAWKLVEPKSMQPLEAALSDLRACRYAGKPCYEVRPLFAQAAPVAPAPQPAASFTEGGVFRSLIEFLLHADDALAFLRCWNEGDFGTCRKEWPEAPPTLYPDVAPNAAPLQQGEYLPLAVASAPDRIWLDLGFDPRETDADFSDLNTPTWSADNASGHGIEYVRADRAARGAAQTAPAEHMLIDWPLYNKDPLLELDDIYADYSKSFGITPGPVMAKIVQRHQARLQSWFGGHREAIRSALVSQAQPAPVAEDAAYTELHGQINYIAAHSVDALDALGRDRLLGFARSLVWRAQTSLEIANLARAQAAQPEGGA